MMSILYINISVNIPLLFSSYFQIFSVSFILMLKDHQNIKFLQKSPPFFFNMFILNHFTALFKHMFVTLSLKASFDNLSLLC